MFLYRLKDLGPLGVRATKPCPGLDLSAVASSFSTGFERTFASGASAPPLQLNVNNALKKADEGLYFNDLAGPQSPVTTLQGIGPKHAQGLESLGLDSMEKLANCKFFHLARSLVTLAATEEDGGRAEASTMNVNKGLDKEYEHFPLRDLIRLPVHALQGISEAKGEVWTSLGVKTVEDLAEFKYCKWAEALTVVAKYEEVVDGK